MGDEPIVRLLEEMRELQKQQLELSRQAIAHQQQAIENQQQAIANQREAVRRGRFGLFVVMALIILIVALPAMFFAFRTCIRAVGR
jgi:hypothetical protein